MQDRFLCRCFKCSSTKITLETQWRRAVDRSGIDKQGHRFDRVMWSVGKCGNCGQHQRFRAFSYEGDTVSILDHYGVSQQQKD